MTAGTAFKIGRKITVIFYKLTRRVRIELRRNSSFCSRKFPV